MQFVIWMTGLPCSGKSTIARKPQDGIPNLEVLDGDELRDGFLQKIFREKVVMNIIERSHILQNYL